MQAVMQRQNFFASLTRPGFMPTDVLDRDFDEIPNRKQVTAEPLDWHECRHWPSRATD